MWAATRTGCASARNRTGATDVKTGKLAAPSSKPKPKAKDSGGRKLSYKEELELQALPRAD